MFGTEVPHVENYHIDAIHHIDVQNRVVVLSFECLIPGREGVGTDFLYFDEEFKFKTMSATRHQLPKLKDEESDPD